MSTAKIQGQDAEDLKKIWEAGLPYCCSLKDYGTAVMRHRWDVFWAGAAVDRQFSREVIDRIYGYANDDHLDTKFKQWQKELDK